MMGFGTPGITLIYRTKNIAQSQNLNEYMTFNGTDLSHNGYTCMSLGVCAS